MAAYRRRSSRPRSRRPSAPVFWIRTGGSGVLPAEPSAFGYLNLASATGDSPTVKALVAQGVPELEATDNTVFVQEDSLIERIHLSLMFQTNGPMYVGVAVLHNPDAFTDYVMRYPYKHANSVDWLAWKACMPGEGAAWVPGGAGTEVVWSNTLDIRSKRRIREFGQSVYLSVQGPATASWQASSSMLIRKARN